MGYDLTGLKFDRWTVVRKTTPQISNREYRWDCVCDCGTTRSVSGHALRTGHSRSCGCLSIDKSRQRNATHGHARHDGSRSRAYKAWTRMIARCHGKKSDRQRSWADRGIAVHEAWRDSFEQFLLDVGEPPEGDRISLDRINNDGNYEPGNVRWATPKEQSRNRRNNRIDLAQAIEIYRAIENGQARTEVAGAFGISRGLIRDIMAGRAWPEAAIAVLPNTPLALIGKDALTRLRIAGFTVVPREPTEAMQRAAEREWDGRMSFRVSGAWRAMIEAAERD